MRPEILFPLFAPITTLKGAGPKLAPLLEKVAGPLVRDVLFVLPTGVIHRPVVKAAEVMDGQVQTLLVHIDRHEKPARAGFPYKIRAYDETGFITLTYFKTFGDSLTKQHPPGELRVVSGKVEDKYGERSIAHPDYLIAGERIAEIPAFEPQYPATAGLASRTVRRFALEALERAPDLPEWIDPPLAAREGWAPWRQAIAAAHEPVSEADVSLESPVRRRLAYDELLAHQLVMGRRRAQTIAHPAPAILPSPLAEGIEAALPYRLTGSQIGALSEIRGDLASGERMSRLLQGDVGSGKTVVAMLAAADAAGAGLQTALMAPTEILARQHFETVSDLLRG
ncbi:MAG: DEAD/DEAH box helicase, partial [Caulobacteraceae bacterium]